MVGLWLYSCVIDYGLLHTMLPRAYVFVSPCVLMGKTAFLPFPQECSKFTLRSSWKEGKGKPKYSLFSVWSQHHNMGRPKKLGVGGGVVTSLCFQNEMGASFLGLLLCV